MNGTPPRSRIPAIDSRTTGPRSVRCDAARREADTAGSCAAAILAGGYARRLGGAEKSGLIIGGQRIIERQLEVLRQLTPDLLIVAREASRIDELGVRVVADLIPEAGPLGGIYTALAHTTAPRTLVVACDMPFLSLAFLQHLVRRAREVEVALPRTSDGYHPLCAVYARTALPAIQARLSAGRLDVIGLVDEVRVAEIGPEELATFDPERVLLSNVNTPQDLRKACAWADRE